MLGNARADHGEVDAAQQGRIPFPCDGVVQSADGVGIRVVDDDVVAFSGQEAAGGPAAHGGTDHERPHPTPPEVMKSP